LCNSHARPQFVDVISYFPEEVEHVLSTYGEIWGNDQHTKAQAFTPAQRLAYRQQHSQPIMEEIKSRGQHLATGDIEENSSLGKAVNYFIKHYDGLTYFCLIEGAKIDNNQIEAMLKIVVRDRKTRYSTKNCSVRP
jgi:transposase